MTSHLNYRTLCSTRIPPSFPYRLNCCWKSDKRLPHTLPASVRLYFIAVDSGKQLNSVAKAALGGMSLAENSGVLTALSLLLLRRWEYRR